MAYVRYVKKEDPFVVAWEELIWRVGIWSTSMSFLNLSIGALYYERFCQKAHFPSQALGRLIEFAGKWDWKQQKKDFDQINLYYKEVQKAFINLKTQKWDEKSDLQNVQKRINEEIGKLNFHIKDFSVVEKQAMEWGTPDEIKVIKMYRKFFTPQLKEIKQFYEKSLTNGLV